MIAWLSVTAKTAHSASRFRNSANDLAQAFALAESLGLDPVVEVEGTPTVAHPITLSQTPATYRSGPPGLPST